MSTHNGYCTYCQQVKKYKRVPGLFSCLNVLSLGILGYFRISSWECTHCFYGCVYLSRGSFNTIPDEPVPQEASAESNMGFKRVKRVASSLPAPPPNGGLKRKSAAEGNGNDELPITVTVDGNFITGDQSLVMKSGRSKLYSEKYRDGMIDRLLAGQTTIEKIRQSTGITEVDLIGWIQQSVERKNKRMVDLKNEIATLKVNALRPPTQEGIDLPESDKVLRHAHHQTKETMNAKEAKHRTG